MNNFTIDFVSRMDYEFLVVEICYRGQRLCQIDQELGASQLRIWFIDDALVLAQHVSMMFPLSEFTDVISVAKRSLIESNQRDS